MSDSRPYSARLLDAIADVAHLCTFRECRVLLAFATFANKDGEAYPPHDDLAAKARLPVRHVREALDSLSVSWLEPRRPALMLTIKHGAGPGRSTVRRLLICDFGRCTNSVQESDCKTVHQIGAPSAGQRCTDLDTKGAPIRREPCTESVRLTGLTGKEHIPPSAKPPVKGFTDYFATAYQRTRGKKYFHAGPKDAAAAKRILAAVGNDLSEAKRLTDRYLADGDSFVTRNGHTLAFLSGRLNSYTAARGDVADIDSLIASDGPSPALFRQPGASS